MKKLRHGIAMMILASCVASPARAGLINGSFEQPNTSGFYTFSAGDLTLPGWAIEAGSVDVQTASFTEVPADLGPQLLDLDGYNPGTVSQIMQATAGSLYKLSFDYAGYLDSGGHENGSPGNSIIYQIFDGKTGTTLATGSVLIQLANVNVWNTLTLQATATSSLLGVRFQSDGHGPNPFEGPLLDGISLELAPATGVPEPSSACLTLIAGLATVACRLRRRPG